MRCVVFSTRFYTELECKRSRAQNSKSGFTEQRYSIFDLQLKRPWNHESDIALEQEPIPCATKFKTFKTYYLKLKMPEDNFVTLRGADPYYHLCSLAKTK
jgi:hypothetical protein